MRTHRLAALTASAFALLIATPAPAAPCAGFVDVDDSSSFCVYIEWLKNRAITLGCTATQYCPSAFVRRDQMAALVYRLGVQNAFLHGGNAFGTTAMLGTTDNRAVQVNVNGSRALLVAPASNAAFDAAPNLVGGHEANAAQITCTGICLPPPEPVVGGSIGGGSSNRVTDSFGTVGGGRTNRAGNDNANHLDAIFATVSGGEDNDASGPWSTVGGGYHNSASGGSATIPGGAFNEAAGAYSFAAGHQAKATHDGCFVWGDSNFGAINCGAPNRFVARATGGVYLISQMVPQTGVRLLPGATSWSMLSDRSLKENIVPVDPEAMLARLEAMPIASWNLVTQPAGVRHIGPMAQDFHAAFGVGEDAHLISTVDAQGVALAAIQGLAARDRIRADAIAALQTRNTELEATVRELAAELRVLRTSLQR
jgi:hypothetical protein